MWNGAGACSSSEISTLMSKEPKTSDLSMPEPATLAQAGRKRSSYLPSPSGKNFAVYRRESEGTGRNKDRTWVEFGAAPVGQNKSTTGKTIRPSGEPLSVVPS